jgi:hypothetical protein
LPIFSLVRHDARESKVDTALADSDQAGCIHSKLDRRGILCSTVGSTWGHPDNWLLSFGLVPVSTQMKGGIEELVVHQETGLMAQNRKDGFLAAIEHLKNDRLNRLRLSHNARQRIVDRYSLDAAASKWEDFLNVWSGIGIAINRYTFH